MGESQNPEADAYPETIFIPARRTIIILPASAVHIGNRHELFYVALQVKCCTYASPIENMSI